MLKTTLKKIFQTTVTTAFGLVIITTTGTAPASAVNLQSFDFSGTFANDGYGEIYLSLSIPQTKDSFLDFPASMLIGGSFDGTYTVDLDQFSPQPSFYSYFQSWSFNLRDSSHKIVQTESSILNEQSFGHWYNNSLSLGASISYYNYSSLVLNFAKDFTKRSTGTGQFQVLSGGRYYGYNNALGYDTYGNFVQTSTINVTYALNKRQSDDNEIEKVPEPMTLGGVAMVGVLGYWMKRKQQKSPIKV